VWRSLAKSLSSSNRRRVVVNISRLNRYTKESEIVAVPGKVLGSGKINHPIKVAAFSFSKTALAKIQKSKGDCLSIEDLMKNNPKGKNVKIME
jgi:large subunit ribosomal protein L18e